jgi:hypothetical protein
MKWKELYKLGISGSRKFSDPSNVVKYVERFIAKNFQSTEEVVVLTGGALGVDAAVELMCMRRGIKNLVVHARWVELERVAGPRRNQHIVDMSNSLLIFWDGSSNGTKDVINKAKKSGKEYQVFSSSQLSKELNLKPPIEIIVPNHTPNRVARRLRDIVEEADITGFLEEIRFKKKREEGY